MSPQASLFSLMQLKTKSKGKSPKAKHRKKPLHPRIKAVHDGLMHCCKNLNWVELQGTPVLRYIFHIADAHPHGKEFGNSHESKEGCL
jgi:hypothetical protein